MPRTILSTVNAIESPTALIVRREMQSWMFLQLEPSSLREPDQFTTSPGLKANGSHMAATLYFLARDYNKKNNIEGNNFSPIYEQVADRLCELIDDVYEIYVDADQTRDLLILRIAEKNGALYPARSLSDGTLRFLALTVLSLDPKVSGVICMEEPENGIHPQRIPAMLTLLKDITCDTENPVGPDNPFRQVIVNTHSPVVVQQVPDESLLVAELKEMVKERKKFKGVQLSWLPDTWRSVFDPSIHTVAKGKLLSYLNPVRSIKAIGEEENKIRRVIDHPYLQKYLPFSETDNE
jgi:predicted ATPase